MNTVKAIEEQQVVCGIITEMNNPPNTPPFNPPVNNNPPTVNYNSDPITKFALVKYKSSIRGKTLDNNDGNDEYDNRKKKSNKLKLLRH